MNKEKGADSWSCERYSEVMEGILDTQIDFTVRSKGGQEKILLEN